MQLNICPSAILLFLVAACASAAPGPRDYRDPNFDYFVTGNPDGQRAARTEFGLALMGGGGNVDAAFAFIAARGGHGHMVILRAVHDDSFDPDAGNYGRSFVEQWGPVSSAETIVFRHRQAAFDPRVIRILKNADGIFLAGGDQSNYVRYWKGTPVQAALDAHVRADRPIGGSSAGLAVLGRYSYTALDGGSLESKVALQQPLDASVTLDDDFLHFRGLEHVIADTHFGRRSRLGRLIVFLARIDGEHAHEQAFGIGIDERSALLIDDHGKGRLAPGSAGSAWIVRPPAEIPVLKAGEPLSLERVRIARMDSSSTLDVDSQGVDAPAAETEVSVRRGVPVGTSFASPLLLRDLVPARES